MLNLLQTRKAALAKLSARTGVALAGLLASAAAFAQAADPFTDFANTVTNWAQGPLGVGLSITMMLVGAGMGIARNSPMPALSGVAGAAFLNWGPSIITTLVSGA